MGWWDRRSSGAQIAIFAGGLFLAVFGILGSLALFVMSALDESEVPEDVSEVAETTPATTSASVDAGRGGSDLPPDTTVTTLPFGPDEEVVLLVGRDIDPGLYRSEPTAFCFWERVRALSDDWDDVLGNGSLQDGSAVVQVQTGDFALLSSRCGPWSPVEAGSGMATTFGPGDHLIGDIAPGVYEADGGESCYWARLERFDGSFGSILGNASTSGQAVAEILDTDVGFESVRCGQWRPLSEPTVEGPEPFGDGMYAVGVHIAPGRYRMGEALEFCHWERYSAIVGTYEFLLESRRDNESDEVVIAPDDALFTTSGCGTWEPIG